MVRLCSTSGWAPIGVITATNCSVVNSKTSHSEFTGNLQVKHHAKKHRSDANTRETTKATRPETKHREATQENGIMQVPA
eukprot:6492053-Amphidinium_carterae.2